MWKTGMGVATGDMTIDNIVSTIDLYSTITDWKTLFKEQGAYTEPTVNFGFEDTSAETVAKPDFHIGIESSEGKTIITREKDDLLVS